MGVISFSESSAEPARRKAFAGARTRHIVQVWMHRLDTLEAVQALSSDVVAAIRATAPGSVIFADYRRAAPLSPQVASAWSRDMRHANGAILRSGVLLDPANAVFNLQLERIVQCAGSDARRLFTDPAELYDWLAEPLTDDERVALRRMLPLP